MLALIVKVVVTALLVTAISELGRRSTLLGALFASLPLTSLLALIWLYPAPGDAAQAADLARGIFWLVLPSLAFFLVLPACIRAGWGFWPAMAAGIAATLVAYAAMLGVDRWLGLKLFA